MSTHPDIIEFITLFERVKEITDGDPGQIPIRARNDETFKALCRQLHTLHFSLDFIKVRDAGDTIIQNVQPKFIEEWRQYEREYHPYIGNVSVAHELLVSHGILSDAPRAPEVSEEVDYENDLHEAREQGDAIRLRLELGSWERNRDLTGELSDKLYNGEKALARQIESLDPDFEKLIFRENRLRTVHVPTHSSKDATNPLSLVSFLQEAHRAFRLGLTLATIGMCRAISDIIIRDHYGVAPDRKTTIKRRFELATADSVAGLKGIDTELHALFNFGSEVLHGRPDGAREMLPHINVPVTATLEQVALHWLKKLVKIVEGVPEK
jgi:hypothetical protein